MSEGWKNGLIKSAGFGAGFALTLAAIVALGFWYVSRPKPLKPWNKTAITAEFLELGTSEEEGTINLWYTLTNSTDADYRIDNVTDITTAGLTRDDDALYAFNQGVSFDVPLIVPARRKTEVMLHLRVPSSRLTIADDASDADVAAYKTSVRALLRSEYANMKGLVVMDEGPRYEIDFPLADAERP